MLDHSLPIVACVKWGINTFWLVSGIRNSWKHGYKRQMHRSEADFCCCCSNCTDVTGWLGATKAARGWSARKCIDRKKTMRSSNTTRTSTGNSSSRRRQKENDGDSNTNSLTNSNSQSQSNAQSLPSVVCIEGNKSVFAAMVGRVVKQTVFPKKQFIILERELDENSKLADSCVKALNLERSKWYSVRNLVRVRLNRVRNNAQQNVRKKLLSKW